MHAASRWPRTFSCLRGQQFVCENVQNIAKASGRPGRLHDPFVPLLACLSVSILALLLVSCEIPMGAHGGGLSVRMCKNMYLGHGGAQVCVSASVYISCGFPLISLTNRFAAFSRNPKGQ